MNNIILLERGLSQVKDVPRFEGAAVSEGNSMLGLLQLMAADVDDDHMAASGQSPRRFHLSMSRCDIASHLSVAHETVSRSFSALVRWGLLSVNDREVEIPDMEKLQVLTCATRRQVDEPIARSSHQTCVRRSVSAQVAHAVAG